MSCTLKEEDVSRGRQYSVITKLLRAVEFAWFGDMEVISHLGRTSFVEQRRNGTKSECREMKKWRQSVKTIFQEACL